MLPKLGIIAGKGELPRQIIAECQRAKRPYYVIALKGHAEPESVVDCPHTWVRLGAAGKMVSILRKEHVSDLVMAGSVNRPSLLELRPDFWSMMFFARTGVANKGDDGLLGALVKALETREGFQVVGAHTLLPNLLAPEGCLGAVAPNADENRDVEVATVAAIELGRQDIGQAVVVRDGVILAREDASGTAAMLSTIVASTDNQKRGVLVKVSKPEQELRADMPTIGPDTITQLNKAGLAGVAIEAGKSIILNKQETLRLADQAGVFVLGISMTKIQ